MSVTIATSTPAAAYLLNEIQSASTRMREVAGQLAHVTDAFILRMDAGLHAPECWIAQQAEKIAELAVRRTTLIECYRHTVTDRAEVELLNAACDVVAERKLRPWFTAEQADLDLLLA